MCCLKAKREISRCVNRDDRPDGGAELFAMVIRAIRQRVPGCGVEVLIPDFQGNLGAVETVMEARPDVLNHNTETVPRLYRQVRLGARYERSLEVLQHARRTQPETPTKSGLMLGLGETAEEVLQVMRDLRAHRVSILTLGQYRSEEHTSELQSLRHLVCRLLLEKR